jgi:NitT/TauT family transport system substrate-binding protein
MKLARLVLPIIVAAGIAGCGPKDGNNSGGGSGRGPGGAVTLRLGFFPNVTHAAALVGTANGMFSQALGSNVKLEEQTYNAGPAEIEALFGDQVDIGYIGPGPAVTGFIRSKGKALRILAGASSGGAALVARVDSGVTDIKSLAGKRVAVPQTGGTQDISLRHALQATGLDSTDKGGNVSVLPVTNADTLTLFVKKELDAAWVPEPWVSRLVKEGNGRVVVDERDLWPNKQFATTVVIVRSEFMKEYPDVVKRFLEGHVQTVTWIGDHKDEARKIVGDRIKQLTGKPIPDDILTNALRRTEITYDPLRESVLTFADWSKALGYQREDRQGVAELIDLGPLTAVLTKAGRPAAK